jgi:hypothetical protein
VCYHVGTCVAAAAFRGKQQCHECHARICSVERNVLGQGSLSVLVSFLVLLLLADALGRPRVGGWCVFGVASDGLLIRWLNAQVMK